MRVACGKSNAKIILMGEHSVVYGKSAIALPFFNAEVSVKIEETDKGIEIISEYYQGQLDQAPEILEGVQALIKNILNKLDINYNGLKITLNSKIPAQRGFGSSAAVSVALTKAFFKFANEELRLDNLKELVGNAEKIHHENPSGLDVATIISKQAIYFIKNKKSEKVDFNLDLDLIVGDTGIPASTKTAVQIVSQQEHKKELIQVLGSLSDHVLKNIENKDSIAMGNNMTAAHEALKELGVSTEKLNTLVNTALNSGALGAKLSGGGLGGCMIALSEKNKTESIVEALKLAGANTTWILDLKEI